MTNIMCDLSISKINMAAFEKEAVISENLREIISPYSFKKLFLIYSRSGQYYSFDWR